MSDTLEKWEQDVEWLYAKAATINKRPTADDEEFFCERVAIIMTEANKALFDAVFLRACGDHDG